MVLDDADLPRLLRVASTDNERVELHPNSTDKMIGSQPSQLVRLRAWCVLATPVIIGLAGFVSAAYTNQHPDTVSGPARVATAFTHVTVLPMDSDRTLTDQTVIVQGDTIASLAPASAATIPAGAIIVEGRGKYLMPGLTDMHVHIRVPEELLSDLVWGVTTVAAYSGSAETLRWREAIKAGKQIGPTIYTTAPIVDGVPPISSVHMELGTPAEAVTVADWEKKSGYDFIKVYNNVNWDAYHALIAEAKAQGITVVGHIPRAVGAEEALRSGQQIAHAEEFYFT
jgi:hypothetical protein